MKTSDRIKEKRKAPISLEFEMDEGDKTHSTMARPSGLFIITEQKILRIRSDDSIDPSVSEPDAPWEQSIHLPHGSRDPLVARTIIQTKLLTEAFFGADNSSASKLLDIAWEVMSSLISLRHIRKRLEAEVAGCVADIEKDIGRYTEGRSPAPLPIVPYYDIEFRSYVNEIRRLLSKVSEVFAAMTEHAGENGHFHKALEWVKKAHGDDSVLARMLEDDLKWIKVWIAVRIAIEHPKKESYVETLNFALEPNRQIRLPTWRLVHADYPSLSAPQNLTTVMEIAEANLLKFFEDLQIALLTPKRFGDYVFGYSLIEESMRDEVAPMRYSFGILQTQSGNGLP